MGEMLLMLVFVVLALVVGAGVMWAVLYFTGQSAPVRQEITASRCGRWAN